MASDQQTADQAVEANLHGGMDQELQEDPVLSKFPRLTLRQKQFAVNPSMPEFYQEHPSFLNFRLAELDEKMRGADGTGAASGEDGSGDAEDPQQVLEVSW